MQITLEHIHAHQLDILAKLDALADHQLHLERRIKRMSVELDRLTASVATITTKADSLIALVQGLAQLIRDTPAERAAMNTLADSIDAEATKLQEAVDANTPPA